MNSSAFNSNWAQITNSNRYLNTLTITLLVLTIICFSLFVFFSSLVFHVFFTTVHVRETSRYILFAHMLANDTMYLVFGFVLVMTTMTVSYIPVPACYAFVTLASVAFRITPYNLAAMALERYAAICFPLKHIMVCTPQRSSYAIGIMWAVALIPNLIDFLILITSVEKTLFSLQVFCQREVLILKPIQSLVRSISLIGSLSLVGVIILFTYIGVVMVAKKASSGSSKASKASRTVILHAFQFLLCLVSLTSPLLESIFANSLISLPFGNFLILTVLPRCLSPIIYGIRDNVFSKKLLPKPSNK